MKVSLYSIATLSFLGESQNLLIPMLQLTFFFGNSQIQFLLFVIIFKIIQSRLVKNSITLSKQDLTPNEFNRNMSRCLLYHSRELEGVPILL